MMMSVNPSKLHFTAFFNHIVFFVALCIKVHVKKNNLVGNTAFTTPYKMIININKPIKRNNSIINKPIVKL